MGDSYCCSKMFQPFAVMTSFSISPLSLLLIQFVFFVSSVMPLISTVTVHFFYTYILCWLRFNITICQICHKLERLCHILNVAVVIVHRFSVLWHFHQSKFAQTNLRGSIQRHACLCVRKKRLTYTLRSLSDLMLVYLLSSLTLLNPLCLLKSWCVSILASCMYLQFLD